MENKVIYTIGHSTHELDCFLELLKEFDINCILDVRSVPKSGYNPQYNDHELKPELKKEGIQYIRFGKFFGARNVVLKNSDDPTAIEFEDTYKGEDFKQGVERLKEGLKKGYRIALMCSEGEPMNCHRFTILCYYLARNGFEIKHIMKDKKFISNRALEEHLLEKYRDKIPRPTLFDQKKRTRDDKLKIAFGLHNQRILKKTMDNDQEEE